MPFHPIRRRLAGALVLLPALCAFGLPAVAQDKYPSKPLTLIVPFGPGSATDAVARVVAEGLARELGQPVVPTNKPGANGMIAIQTAKASPSDGYNLLFLANGVVNEQVIKKTAFDIRKDLVPVARVVQAPLGVFASNQVPANSMKELVEYARKNPGKLNFASAGVGSIAHLTTERIKLATKTDMVHVPYPAGTAPMTTALIAGDVGLFVNEMGSMKGFVADKRVKVLATLADQRNPIYPDAPSAPETGVPELRNFSANFFFGIFVEPATPPDRVELLNRAINKVLTEPAVRDRLVGLGYNPASIGGMTPVQFRGMVNDELSRIEAVARDAKIQVQ
ncbi:Bug family tripartite tricarboxylate transporter substrate binding protein [Ramlibacter sp.]|uniref:Bug family tripartite tricarboxylate transporter substrate binding protein n=1 Tax=Ramlibacter sp. TaxID=1917967 RepID=UPI003D0BBC61